MQSLNLYLDEHLSPRLAEQMRQYGFDVLSTIRQFILYSFNVTHPR